MPPPLPDRYRLEVRLGRDDDIEEWLATDESLSRPVLIRFLGPESDAARRGSFLASVRAAAAVNHAHMASVYSAEEVVNGAYSVCEWTGGISIADRLAADETMEVEEFLPNAAGLADALAALHREGHLHGAIDPSAVFHSVAHPARLGAFGRVAVDHTPSDDVRSLAAVLELGLTGSLPGGPPPSEIVDGLDPAVDHALRTAQRGGLTARHFADLLRAAPSPVPAPVAPPERSRRFLLLVIALAAAGLGLIAVGRFVTAGDDRPPLFPSTTAVSDTVAVPTTTGSTRPVSGAPTTVPLVDLVVTEVRTVDPFGGGDENDDRVGNIVDGDLGSAWRTERYRDPLPLLKAGVGLAFQVLSDPKEIIVSGMDPGTVYEIAWSVGSPDPATWEVLIRGVVGGVTPRHQLPQRSGGTWILWFTDLPRLDDGDHSTQVSEVRFRA